VTGAQSIGSMKSAFLLGRVVSLLAFVLNIVELNHEK